MKCWECGSAITAEQKTKQIKTTWESKTYVYYHCTKRKEGCGNCSQKSVSLEGLENQINDILSSIEIIPEFKDWCLEALKLDFENWVKEKATIRNNLLTLVDKEERKLAKLTEYLLSETINEEEYNISKKQTKIDIGIYREKLNKLNNEKDESIEDTERVFNFIVQARSYFNHWNLQTKKEIFRALGLNWVLKDWVLHYKAFPWFEIMQEFNRENGSKNTSLELIKNSTNTGCSGAENGEKEKWYGLVFSVRMEILKWWEKIYLPTF